MSIYQLKHGQRGTSNGPGNAKGLRIGHINAQGLKRDKKAKKFERLEDTIKKHKFDVFGVTETHYSDQTPARTPDGYQRAEVECRKKCGGGGVAVYVKEGVDYILKDSRTYRYDKESKDCMGPEDDHPVQFIHIKVTRVTRVTRVTKSRIPHIHVVIIYVSPNAVHKLTALVPFLQVKMCGYSSVVVLSDVNENAFLSTFEHTEKAKESDFGQIITEVTRPASKTLLDHIYVKAFPFTNSLKKNVEGMVYKEHSGVVKTCNIGDHDLIFCVVGESYLNRNYENPRAAHYTLLKSMGVAEQQARHDLKIFAIRLIQHLVDEAKPKTKTPKTKKLSPLSEETALLLCRGLSISARNAMEYHNKMLEKWPTQLNGIHITCDGKDVIRLENKSSNESELETNELECFLHLCIFSGGHKLKLHTMKLDIIDKSSLVDRRWSLPLDKAVDKVVRSKSRGVGMVRYTVPETTNRQNYHAYVASLVSELDVLLTPGERGARTVSNGYKGEIFFSAGTKHELTSSLYKITKILPQLNPEVSFTSWRFDSADTLVENIVEEDVVEGNVCLDDVKTEMDLPFK